MRKLFVLSLLITLGSCQSGELSPASGSYSVSDSFAGSSVSKSSSGNGSVSAPEPKAGVITAGEWADLANWPFWQGLMQNEEWSKLCAAWRLTPADRYQCLIRSASGQPATDVLLTVRDTQQRVVWEGKTDMTGRAYITPQLFAREATGPFEVKATVAQQSILLGKLLDAAQETAFQIPSVVPTPQAVVEVQLVVDATGSMGDEMEYLKNELNDVVQQAQSRLPNTTFRMSSVFYRDKEDDYITRPLPFTNDLTSLIRFIGQQQANGGGDFPEAVDEGLEAGLNQQWGSSARTRILFLVLDAPPHNDSQTIERMVGLAKRASQKGIHIIPITASGIDKSTEFLMRTLAIGTQGTYVFITDHSGIGDKHLEPTIGEYKVEFLNELMTRLIVKYSQP